MSDSQNRGTRTKEHGRVWSCNEWDPLEEVIVGTVENAMVPEWNPALEATTPPRGNAFFKEFGGKPFPEDMVAKATVELDGLSKLLTELGVTVKRPNALDFSQEIQTPWWKSKGLYAAMPRDVAMVVGDTIVEAPMAWRSRYFETFAYHDLFYEYFNDGARWLSAPSSTMGDDFYNPNYDVGKPFINNEKQFVISNKEIAFDAADFFRCGKDLFVQKSNVTNSLGIEWVRRQLDPEFTVHEVEFWDMHPMHIDTTIVPLAPGKLLINPSWVKDRDIPEPLSSWDILHAPEPVNPFDAGLYFSSDWLTMNTLSLDEKRILVEEQETPFIEALKKWGFEPIPLPFRNFYPFGGAFHCATLDVRRRGDLESYFK